MTIKIMPARDRTIDLAALRRALAVEGVRPGRMYIVADGEVEGGDQFRIDGWPNAYALTTKLPPGKTRLHASVRLTNGVPELRPK